MTLFVKKACNKREIWKQKGNITRNYAIILRIITKFAYHTYSLQCCNEKEDEKHIFIAMLSTIIKYQQMFLPLQYRNQKSIS